MHLHHSHPPTTTTTTQTHITVNNRCPIARYPNLSVPSKRKQSLKQPPLHPTVPTGRLRRQSPKWNPPLP